MIKNRCFAAVVFVSWSEDTEGRRNEKAKIEYLSDSLEEVEDKYAELLQEAEDEMDGMAVPSPYCPPIIEIIKEEKSFTTVSSVYGTKYYQKFMIDFDFRSK